MNVNLNLVTPYQISDRVFNDDMIYLDWNESPYKPEPVIEYFKKNPFNDYNLYPDPTNINLKIELSNYTNVDLKYIETFNGSDSALDYIFRVLLNVGDKVLIPKPNYTQINQSILSLGSSIHYCDVVNISQEIKQNDINVVYLSNPNNPIGYVQDVLPLIESFPNVYFIIDEAYYEFETNYSVFQKAHLLNNLVVTRTFSKALSLASLRLGYISSNDNFLEKIRRIKNFKEVNKLAEVAGVITLKNIDWYFEKVKKINETKVRFINEIKHIKSYNSHANFVLIEHNQIKNIIEECKNENILIRDRSSLITNTARITIGDDESMNKLIRIINKVTK